MLGWVDTDCFFSGSGVRTGLQKHVIILNPQKKLQKKLHEFTLSDLFFLGVFSVFQLLQIWGFFGFFWFSNFFRFGFFLGFFSFPTISVKMIRFAKIKKNVQIERFRDPIFANGSEISGLFKSRDFGKQSWVFLVLFKYLVYFHTFKTNRREQNTEGWQRSVHTFHSKATKQWQLSVIREVVPSF